MAIKGKVEYKVYLDRESVEFVRSVLPQGKGKGGLSKLIDDYIINQAVILKRAGLKPGATITPAKALRSFVNGVFHKEIEL